MATPWVRTAQAAAHLGRSPRTLLRLISNGKVTPGTHYLRGLEPNSPVTWNIDALEKRWGELMAMDASSRGVKATTTTEDN